MKYDFCGWATRNDIKCSDGRTIKANAFKEQDGKIVPLVWQHDHTSPEQVLGHALLENRKEGVFAYATFNDTEMGNTAKELVKNGDVTSLSIYANKLKQDSNANVMHGVIREVSLVLAGANPGAYITNVAIAHGDSYDEVEDEMIYEVGSDNVDLIVHSGDTKDKEDDKSAEKDTTDENQNESSEDDSGKTIGEILKDLTEDQEEAIAILVEAAANDEDLDDETAEKVGKVLSELTDEQKEAVTYIIGKAIEDKDSSDEDDDDNEEESEEGDSKNMKHNAFEEQDVHENDEITQEEIYELAHDALRDAIDNNGSLKQAVLSHAAQHGIENVEYLFPDPQSADDQVPELINRPVAWAELFNANVTITPFGRIKNIMANITADEARARGYIKGKEKPAQVLPLLRRETTPTTILIRQDFDRDDVVDAENFDIVAFAKSEMEVLREEEEARARLFGDGRDVLSNDKVDETKIRPIANDAELYAIHRNFAGSSDEEKAKNFIKAHIKAMANYRGSGNPFLFIKQSMLTNILLLQDQIGRDLYDSIDKLATKLQVAAVIAVPDEITNGVASVTVNPRDYKVGMPSLGKETLFEGFDIKFNLMQYLLEGRTSGALVKPFSAIVMVEDTVYSADEKATKEKDKPTETAVVNGKLNPGA